MKYAPDSLPQDVGTLQALLLTERAARLAAENEVKLRALQIGQLKVHDRQVASPAVRPILGAGCDPRTADLQLTELQESASEAEAALQVAAAAWAR